MGLGLFILWSLLLFVREVFRINCFFYPQVIQITFTISSLLYTEPLST